MSLVVTRVFEPQVYTESLFLPSKVLAVGSAEKIVALVVRVIVPGLHVRPRSSKPLPIEERRS